MGAPTQPLRARTAVALPRASHACYAAPMGSFARLAVFALCSLAGVARADVPAAPRITIPPATIDETLSVTGSDVRARALGDRLAVPVHVDGHGPFRFIVDSGADRSVIGTALAARLALPPRGRVRMHSMAGASDVETVLLSRLQLGESEARDIAAPALAEADLGADGLIGIDALAEQRLMLDFDKGRITVQPATRREPARGDGEEIIVTARRRKGQLIITEVRIGQVPAMAVIDTGAEMSVGNAALAVRLGRALKPLASSELTTVTGAKMTVKIALLPKVQIASLTLGNVPIAFVETPTFALFGLADQPAILLGSDLLEAFRRVSLDFRRRKVRFTLRPGQAIADARSDVTSVSGYR